MRLSSNAPQGCKAVIARRDNDEGTKTLSEALSEQFNAVAIATAGGVSLVCPGQN